MLRRSVRLLIDACPALYLPLCRLRANTRGRTIGWSTEIVIEGFPRSGNSFAVAAFVLAQRRAVAIAHHLHAPAHVVAGVKRGIPTLVLIRRPRDAVLSLSIREPHISIEQGLKDYIRFYNLIGPYREGYTVAEFAEVIGRYGNVMRRLNTRFGTDYKLFDHTEENVKRCFQLVEIAHRSAMRAETVDEMAIERPSQERDERRRELEKSVFQTSKERKLLREAERVYAKFLAQSAGRGVTSNP